MPSGSFIQKLNARTIDREGSPVVVTRLPLSQPPLRAIKVDDQRRISRLLPEDGLDQPDKAPVVFVFSGALYETSATDRPICPLVHDDQFTFGDVLYTLESLHPTFVGDICTELCVLAYKTG